MDTTQTRPSRLAEQGLCVGCGCHTPAYCGRCMETVHSEADDYAEKLGRLRREVAKDDGRALDERGER